MKVGFPTDKIYIKNKGIDLQQQNHALVFGIGENFCNFKQEIKAVLKAMLKLVFAKVAKAQT